MLALITTLLVGLPALANDAPEADASKAEAVTVTKIDADTTVESTQRVYQTKAATIVWDQSKQIFRAPDADEAQKLSQQIEQWKASFQSGQKLMPTHDKVTVRPLENGLFSARIPVDLLNSSVVRVDSEGDLHAECSGDLEGAAVLLTQPVTETNTAVEE